MDLMILDLANLGAYMTSYSRGQEVKDFVTTVLKHNDRKGVYNWPKLRYVIYGQSLN